MHLNITVCRVRIKTTSQAADVISTSHAAEMYSRYRDVPLPLALCFLMALAADDGCKMDVKGSIGGNVNAKLSAVQPHETSGLRQVCASGDGHRCRYRGSQGRAGLRPVPPDEYSSCISTAHAPYHVSSADPEHSVLHIVRWWWSFHAARSDLCFLYIAS